LQLVATGGYNLLVSAVVEELAGPDCFGLMDTCEIGRIGYSGRYGPLVLPVNYRVHDAAVVFRTGADGPLVEDLYTGIRDADYRVCFEIDQIDQVDRSGWSVIIQGAAHLVEDEAERDALMRIGLEPWPGGSRDVFVRIAPRVISGRRITRPE
jgi:nitroimidazol reductase NimA-like FMN-containing flavoprotein (pyridoxamine 5'-phosphate oxidase superfamily)